MIGNEESHLFNPPTSIVDATTRSRRQNERRGSISIFRYAKFCTSRLSVLVAGPPQTKLVLVTTQVLTFIIPTKQKLVVPTWWSTSRAHDR